MKKVFNSTYKIIHSREEEKIDLLPLHLQNDPDDLDEEEEDLDNEETTLVLEKEPIEESDINSFRIILLKCIPVDNQFYTDIAYEVILKKEDDLFWHGVPLKNQGLGKLKWSKEIWYKIYDFEMSMHMRTYYK